MIIHSDPKKTAVEFLNFSLCKVQVAAVLSDQGGIFSIAWNYGDNGCGVHAEFDVIRKADPLRIPGSKLTIAGRRRKSGNFLLARPCEKLKHGSTSASGKPCLELASENRIATIEYITKDGQWEIIKLHEVLKYMRV